MVHLSTILRFIVYRKTFRATVTISTRIISSIIQWRQHLYGRYNVKLMVDIIACYFNVALNIGAIIEELNDENTSYVFILLHVVLLYCSVIHDGGRIYKAIKKTA